MYQSVDAHSPQPTARIRSWVNEYHDQISLPLKGRILGRLFDGEEPKYCKELVRNALADRYSIRNEHDTSTLDLRAEIVVERIRLAPATVAPPSPRHDPEPAVDIANYIARWHRRYRDCVDRLSAQIPPMHPACEASVCIPMAAIDEIGYIYRALESFSSQTLGNDRFEVLVLANYPKKEGAAHSEEIAATIAEVKRFISDYPDVRVNLMCSEHRGSTVSRIGFVRALIKDVAVLRHAQRSSDQDHILLRCDADTRGADCAYLENFVLRFKSDPFVDSLYGQTLWSPERFAKNPLLLVSQILDEVLAYGERIYLHRSSHGGPNFAIRASVYALLGGDQENIALVEDGNLYQRLLNLRRDGPYVPIDYAGSRSRLVTSARRAEEVIGRYHSSRMQWSLPETAFKQVDTGMRAGGEMRSDERPFNDREVFLRQVERLINHTLWEVHHWAHEVTPTFPAVAKALRLYLGLKYEVIGSAYIRITDGTTFFERVKEIQEHGVARLLDRLNRRGPFLRRSLDSTNWTRTHQRGD